MLQAIFLILLLQLAGEIIQQFFQLTVPGPVIGLVMLLCMLLVHRRLSGKMRGFEQQLITTSESLLRHLSLLFVPIGVGVVMHLQLLERQLLEVVAVIVFGTLSTLVFSAVLFQLLMKNQRDETGK